MPFGKTVLLGVVAGAYVGLCAALLMTGGRRMAWGLGLGGNAAHAYHAWAQHPNLPLCCSASLHFTWASPALPGLQWGPTAPASPSPTRALPSTSLLPSVSR